MRTSLFIDGDFAPYDSRVLVEISRFDDEATFSVSLDPPDGGELVTYQVPLEVVVRLVVRYRDPDFRKDVEKAFVAEVARLAAEVAT